MSLPITSSASLQNTTTVQSQPLVLQEGQMVHGNIKQLFPGQTAEIQIGNQSMVAKLEVPMKVGDSYYFQVQSVKPEIQLKVIAGPTTMEEGKGQQVQRLMEAMNLPKTAEMSQLLQFVLKNKVPMTREQLLQAEALLKTIPPAGRADALAAIQRVVSLKLPLTESIFQAVLGVQSKEGLHQHIQHLQGLLQAESSPKIAALVQSLQSMSKPFAETTGQSVIAHALHQIMDPKASTEMKFSYIQLLKSANVLPSQTSLANIQQVLMNVANSSEATPITAVLQRMSQSGQPITAAQITELQQAIMNDKTITANQKNELLTLIQRMGGQQINESNHNFVRAVMQTYVKAQAEQVITQPFDTANQSGLLKQFTQNMTAHNTLQLVENSQEPMLQKLLQQAEQSVANAVNGNAIKNALQSMFRAMGINYEAAILAKDANLSSLLETVKPQLLALMQDPAISQQTKSQAEFLVSRLNGPLLASGEQGVQHQLVMQVPLEFFGKKIDATLQWSGRMKENNQIDPDYARILFYLDLHSIEKTVVDMQVQNRVVSVTIFNEHPEIKMIGMPIYNQLQAGLKQHDYALSGVFFKTFSEENVEKPITKNQAPVHQQGVDYRI